MSTSTLAAPTQNMQINNDLYVGKGFLLNIQQAVSFGVAQTTADGQGYRVIIPAGYQGSDSIAAVTGGSTNLVLEDQRGATPAFYLWSNASGAFYGPMIDLTGYLYRNNVLDFSGNHLTLQGAAPPPAAGDGATSFATFQMSAGDGQSTTGTTGQSGGDGADIFLLGGEGGSAPAGSANGNGGLVILKGGLAGTGAGTAATPGFVAINAEPGCGQTIIGYNGASPTVIAPNGDLSAPNITTPAATIDALTTPAIASPAARPLIMKSPVAIVLQGQAGDGGTYIGGSNAAALVVQPGGAIASPSASFGAATVANSPVRTFANSPDAPDGMEWPPAGIGVSTGTAWETDSIDPATLRTFQNTPDAVPQVYPPAGVPNSTGSAWGTSILRQTAGSFIFAPTVAPPPAAPATEGTMQTWNLSGTEGETDLIDVISAGAVNGGFRWFIEPVNTALDSNTQAKMILDKNGMLIVTGGLECYKNSISVLDASQNPIPIPYAGSYLGFTATQNQTYETDFINAFPANYVPGGFNWYAVDATNPTSVDGTTPVMMRLDKAGDLSIAGALSVAGYIPGSLTAKQGLNVAWNVSGGNGESDFINGSGATPGGFKWYNSAVGGVLNGSTAPIAALDAAGNMDVAGTITAGGGGNLLIGSTGIIGTTAGQLTLSGNFVNIQVGGSGTSGNGSVWFFPTGGVEIGGYNNDPGFGSLYCTGTITSAGAKAFKIVHPQDSSKYLIHACLEGPEIAVFYRGEGQTGEDGLATITLPDYFEALTAKTGRTVQLTELFEDDDTDIGKLAASRVKDGKFTVRSEYASQRFYWEVKAVRADVDPLIITTDVDA
jgi:hypothetical protein